MQIGNYGFRSCRPNWAAIARTTSGPERPADSCLVNLYRDGARMGLHQDKDEADLTAPVLSVSLGDTAVFRIGPAAGRATRSHDTDAWSASCATMTSSSSATVSALPATDASSIGGP